MLIITSGGQTGHLSRECMNGGGPQQGGQGGQGGYGGGMGGGGGGQEW